MVKKRISMLLATMMICGVAFVGCSNNTTEPKSNATTASKVEDKKLVEQVLNMPLYAEPDSLDLARVSDSYSMAVVSQVVEGLTTVEVKDGKEVIKGGLAESWEPSEDKLTWTFKLRDAKWSDGVQVKAQDFVYGITRILDPKTASPISSDVKFIKNAQDIILGKKDIKEAGVKAIDDKTLEITLEYSVPYFLYVAGSTSMLPSRQDIVEEYGDSYGTEADKFVFCGPFVIDKWVHNSKVSFSKNPNYWDADNVKLEKVNMKIINEETAMVGEFENGELDFIDITSTEWIKELEQKGDYEKYTLELPRTQYIFFNQNTPVFSNAKVRQAFSIALNREEIFNDISKGLEPAAYGWLPPAISVDEENFRKLAGDPIKKLIEENPDAKALLIEGLKELNMDEDPSKVNIKLMCPSHAKGFAEYLQQSFRSSLGVNLEIDPVEWPVFQERNRNLDYEMGFKSYGSGINDPAAMMELWITGVKTVPTAWSNEEYDSLVNEANESIDKELRAKNFVKAEEILLKDAATIIPYAYSQSIGFRHKYLKNLEQTPFASISLKNVYIEK